MKNTFNLIIASLMIFIIGCDFNPTSPSEQISYSDSEIMGMIKNAEKIEISFDELPSQSKDIVQNEHIDYESFKNWRASGIGYLAELSGRGQNVGNFREVYFDMDGRKLEHINSEDEERPEGDGTDVECFELILPVTYAMPDSSNITIETEESWSLLRSWYDSNPESEEEAVLQYPVNIVYETESGDSSVVINDEEAMIAAKEACYDEWEENDEEWEEGDDEWEENDEEWEEGDDEWGEDEADQCYAFVYPISFTMPDGTTLTLENEEGFRELEFWYESNIGSEEEPSFLFPIEIVVRDEQGETTFTINNDEELEAAEENCED